MMGTNRVPEEAALLSPPGRLRTSRPGRKPPSLAQLARQLTRTSGDENDAKEGRTGERRTPTKRWAVSRF